MPIIKLVVSYKDRDRRHFEDEQIVEFTYTNNTTQSTEDSGSSAPRVTSSDTYDNNGIRKAVLLARYLLEIS